MENREYRKVIEYVKNEIKRGHIHLEDKLPAERVMAEELDMSRGSVREALRTMENMGMLESRQGSGNYLTGNLNKAFQESISMMFLLKQVSYSEVNTLRRAVETEAYTLAIKNISDNQIKQLKEVLESMQTVEIDELILRDKEFHYQMIRASENHLIISIMDALEEIYAASVEHMLRSVSEQTKNKLVLCHEKMLDCMIRKDEDGGRKAVNEHYDLLESCYHRKK
ncbi:FadR/GntR family transcriptional regulator [Aminipila luticellarii]|uniref:FadR/GntR family transcriptional regulator n=1 Tax=Aminipila luticellarii TaxID=2507160 RepID=UPI0013E8D6DE|nr:FCD domain-containing protein [Aminipila luticellarii]